MRMANLFRTSALAALNVADETGGAVVVIPAAEPEAASEAAVEIARIEGETAVALAEIHVAADLAHHELSVQQDTAFAETLAENINESLEAEKTEWQIRAETAEAELTLLKAAQTPAASSIPAQSPPAPPPSPPPGEDEDGQREAVAVLEPEPEQSPPSPPAEPPKRHKKARWI